MTSSMLRRQLKNLVQNYSEAEVKVREATSNDPWGPSSTQMADLSDLTYNVVACNEIMTMLWKRLKDDRNWRHIHKSLTLLEYLLKTGDDRVLLKMKDNVYIVKALTEYRFSDKDGKDQGVNVREKAKVVLVLMEDDEKLKEERDFAFKTREKTSKGAAASSTDAIKDPNYKPCYVAGASGLPSLDNIPSVADLTAAFAAKKEERAKHEHQKKEAERRAKLSEDELQWEDAGKGPEVVDTAWGEEKEEETDEWGAPKEPKEAEGPWGTPDRPETTDAETADPFVEGEDPFAPPEEVKFTEDDSEDPFQAPKDKTPDEKPKSSPVFEEDAFTSRPDDPFNAPKEDPFKAKAEDPFASAESDPFGAPKDDPFSAKSEVSSKSEDPFGVPKDDPFFTKSEVSSKSEDPFGVPKDDPFSAKSQDPFGVPKDDRFSSNTEASSKSEDPFGAPKDDPFSSKSEDPFGAPKDDPFTASKPETEDPFGAPKDDPFTTSKSAHFDDFKEDPFGMPAEDPFVSAKEAAKSPPLKDDPFVAGPNPVEEGFEALISPTEDPFSTGPADDPFAAPTSPPKEDPFSASTKPSGDPFASPTSPLKEDPFTAAASSPKDPAVADPFSAPSPPGSAADAWGEPASPPPSSAGDPWGDSAKSPMNDADPFGDSTKADDDPWGAPAAAPVNTDDAWGAPAPDTLPSPSDPFGSKSDPWGAPSTNSQNTGLGSVSDLETFKKTSWFLGSAAASLVDLDDLFSSNPAPKHGCAAVAKAVAAGVSNAPCHPRASAWPGGHLGSTLTPSYFGLTSPPSAPAQSFQMEVGSNYAFNMASPQGSQMQMQKQPEPGTDEDQDQRSQEGGRSPSYRAPRRQQQMGRVWRGLRAQISKL
uniref:ENTH domain-containing protein n=1 Tax=Knipowitschia caucasica TaxID=637954 RepID=A0AAV2K1E0_KNICA